MRLKSDLPAALKYQALVIESAIDDAGFAFPASSVVLFSGLLAALAVLFGLLPAWDSVRAEPSATLHEA